MKTQLKPAVSVAAVMALAFGLASCSSDDAPSSTDDAKHSMSHMAGQATSAGPSVASQASSAAHEHMKMDGGQPPAGIKKASNPKFPVGTKVMLTADHMPGMKNTQATVVGAFTTYTYAVTYTPVKGGPQVKNHKWVVQQEIKDAGDKRLKDGEKVTLEADHMPGMKGAEATIDSSTDQTVYMVNFNNHGMAVKNHKWVTEDEMRPAGHKH